MTDDKNKTTNGAQDPGQLQDDMPVKRDPAGLDPAQEPTADDVFKDMRAISGLWQQKEQQIMEGLQAYRASANEIAEGREKLGKAVSEALFDVLQKLPSFKALDASFAYQLNRTFQTFMESLQESLPEWAKVAELADEVIELEPYLQEELKKPEYGGQSMDDLFDLAREHADDADEITIGGLFMKALNAARAAREAKEMEGVPRLQSTGAPKHFIIPNTALINALEALDGKGEVIGGGPLDIPVINTGKSNEVTIFVDASLDNMDGIEISGKPWTEFDRAIFNGVISLYEDRVKKGVPPLVTADIVYRTITNKTDSEEISPQQKGSTTKSIEKMWRNIFVKADVSAELAKRKATLDGKPITEFLIEDHMLLLKKITAKAGGKRKVAYLVTEPPLLTHAKATGQIISIKSELLDIKNVNEKGEIQTTSIPLNEYRLCIVHYLIRRIEIMKRDEREAIKKYENEVRRAARAGTQPAFTLEACRRQSRIILYGSVIAAAGITNKNTATAAKQFILQALAFWKAKNNIADYTPRQKGRRPADAVIISIAPTIPKLSG